MGHFSSTEAGWPALDAVVAEVLDTRRAIAALHAKESRLLADAVDLALQRAEATQSRPGKRVDHDLPLREASAELACAMRLSDRTVQARMGDAITVATRFGATEHEWRAGRIDTGHVHAIVDAGTVIADDAARARFEEQALVAAQTQSPARLRSLARAIAASVDPGAAARLTRRGVDERMVRVADRGDGIARLIADLPAPLAFGIHDRLTQMAREVRDAQDAATCESDADSPPTVVTTPSARVGGSGEAAPPLSDARTMDQIRADLFADLLLAGAPAAHGDGDGLAAITGHVQVTVPALTLAGIDGEPALLAGYGPIDPDFARRLAEVAPGWDRVLTDPHTGAPLAVDRYRPSKELRRFLGARDEHCRFPGCRVPARRCDIDHTVDAALGGETSLENLAHLCRRHYTLKHATQWSVRRRGGGVLEWTSPAGRHHVDRPAPTVRFVPSDRLTSPPHAADPPPF